MSLSTEVKVVRKDLKTGVHLVTIVGGQLVKGHDKQPIVTKDGEVGLTVRFANSKKEAFDKVFWLKGKREKEFNKMLNAAQVRLETKNFNVDAKGHRLWIYIREVYDIIDDEILVDEITGEQVVNYYIFDYSPAINPENRPAVMGDPETNGGIAGGKFIDYRQVKELEGVKKKSEVKEKVSDDNFPLDGNPLAEKKPESAIQPNSDFGKERSEEKVSSQEEDDIDWENLDP